MANQVPIKHVPHIIGPGLFLVTQGTYGNIMVKELVCRLRVLGSAIYVHDLTGLIAADKLVITLDYSNCCHTNT